MKVYNPFGPKHFAREMQASVNEICQPLFKQLELNYFHYFKTYKEGSAIILYSRLDWHDHWFKRQFRPAVPLSTQEIRIGQYNLCLWRGVVPEHILREAKEVCNLDYFLGLSVAFPNFFESYAFGSAANNEGIINTYFNSLEILFKFIDHFKKQAADLILKYEANPIVFPNSYQPKQLTLLDNLNTALTVVGNKGEVKITLKELGVLRLLCQGLTIKEMGRQLDRSPRTIEMHLNHLKTKLGCQRKSQLISTLITKNDNFVVI